MANTSKIISLPFLWAIRLYQKTLSFDHGVLRFFYPNGFCQFHPTCSEYGYQALERYGPVKGLSLALLRVLRCHPWSRGGADPLL